MPLLLAALALIGVATGCSAVPPPADPAPRPGAIAPVIDRDFPDPDILEVDGTFYAYATNSADANVQVASSTDLETWTALEDAFPELPPWVRGGDTWAPEVTAIADDDYRLYYTAASLDPEAQCIGVASATRPEGPFIADGDGMLVCPGDEGGAIDATTFRHRDGSLWLIWKNDGNCCDLPVWISATPLSADGRTLAGDRIRLITTDLPWEGQVVEAPTLLEVDGRYHLFYSAGFYGDDGYSTGHAVADDLAGPWVKDETPLMSSDTTDYRVVGPGGQDVFDGPDGERMIAFHGWDEYLTYRALYLAPLVIGVDGSAEVELPKP